MLPDRLRFFTDILSHVNVTVENNWDPWCQYDNDATFWAEKGARALAAYAADWEAYAQAFRLYEDGASCQLLYTLMVYRVLGYRHIALPQNTPEFWAKHRQAAEAVVEDQVTRAGGYDLPRLKWGNIEYVGHPAGTLCIFLLRQYQFDRVVPIRPEPGDVVLDLGGCWGDSGLAFAERVGDEGRVYVFEFVEGNLRIAEENFAANRALGRRIELVRHPVSNVTGEVIYYNDLGPTTMISDKPAGMSAQSRTVTIDDFVALKELDRVDFIKMDIEGIEAFALEGAAQTIRRYKPKLAISAYHLHNDMIALPAAIRAIRPDYRFFVDHYAIFDQETVLYAV